MFSRREFLGFCLLLGLPLPALARDREKNALLLTARDDNDGRHFFTALNLQGERLFEHELAYRGHGFAVHAERRQAVIFARRPGTEALVVDYRDGRIFAEFTAAPGRHFYGHGCYSRNGALLFSSENDYAQGRGVIGIRRVGDYRQIGEFSSHGIGPHDMHLLPDGQTLVVANGGIRSHPDFPRRELNLDAMQPSLVFMKAATGELLSQQTLSDAYLSIRHLTLLPDGAVAAALQDNRPGRIGAPLLALSRNGELALLTSLHHGPGYAADVCFNPLSRLLAVTAPRSGQVLFWSYPQAEFVGALALADTGGIAALPASAEFLIGSGSGAWWRATPDKAETLTANANAHWDNHALLVV